MAGARRAKKAHVGGELKFEEAIARLEAIVKELEGAEVPLEKALGLFEEGVRLSKLCNATLEEAEKKVRVLLKNEAGELEEGPSKPRRTRTKMPAKTMTRTTRKMTARAASSESGRC